MTFFFFFEMVNVKHWGRKEMQKNRGKREEREYHFVIRTDKIANKRLFFITLLLLYYFFLFTFFYFYSLLFATNERKKL